MEQWLSMLSKVLYYYYKQRETLKNESTIQVLVVPEGMEMHLYCLSASLPSRDHHLKWQALLAVA
jgi:hypothetical protein